MEPHLSSCRCFDKLLRHAMPGRSTLRDIPLPRLNLPFMHPCVCPSLAKFPLLFIIFDPLPSVVRENAAKYGDWTDVACSSA